MILSRFDDNESQNEKLWYLWKDSMMCLDEQNGELFFNHIRTHINRLIEKKVHEFTKYEDIRYNNREKYNMVIAEGTCINCSNEYVYLPVPIVVYMPNLFYDRVNSSLHWYARNAICQKCKNRDFDFMLI
jgi:hypothetical protein